MKIGTACWGPFEILGIFFGHHWVAEIWWNDGQTMESFWVKSIWNLETMVKLWCVKLVKFSSHKVCYDMNTYEYGMKCIALRSKGRLDKVIFYQTIPQLDQGWVGNDPTLDLCMILSKSRSKRWRIHGAFLKWRYPQSSMYRWIFHDKPSSLGYPHFWKPLCGENAHL